MSMIDSFFNKGFKAAKCKTLLKLTIPRIKLLRNRREIQLKNMRRDIAKLLETGQEATARIRVEHIIREENMMAAQEIIELFCELISVRLPIIETQRECPLDLKEAISSVCFAAPRCADLPELLQVQILFASKYGKEFVAAATELMPSCGVNRQLIELLSVRAPSPEKKLKLLKEIAEENELDWDPAASETELLKKHEDLLNGLTHITDPTPVAGPTKSMELTNEESAGELLQAQTHVWNHIFSFINSMTLKCAVQLGIPDVIQEHGKPMTLSELVSALPIHPSKAQYVHRLMRILVHSGFFSQQNLNQEAYSLTQSARLLLKDNPWSMRPVLLFVLDPVLTKPHDCLSTWFQNDEATAFSVAHENTIWEYAGQDARLNNLFNEAMASDSILASKLVVSKCRGIFDGVDSLVDVGGGLGTMAKGIAEAFPHMDCTVFDLPHVVSDLQGSKNLKYVGGDMFQAVPPADAILLKWVLHDWSDEDCVKVLKRCKQAIASKGQQKVGKVIIIDMVRENQNGDEGSIETQLFFDLQMMVAASGMERNEKEWAKLFFDAGFLNYKIHPVLGARALIELYP